MAGILDIQEFSGSINRMIIDGYRITAIDHENGTYSLIAERGTDRQMITWKDGDNYVITEEDYQHIADLVDITRVKALEEKAQQHAEKAETYAAGALASFQATEENRDVVESLKRATDGNAASAAENARKAEAAMNVVLPARDEVRAAETNAKQSETQALRSATQAKLSETNAAKSASAASTHEQNSKWNSDKAIDYANAAANSSISALTSANNAKKTADSVLNLSATATTLPEGSSAKVIKTVGSTVNLEFQIPKGDKGDRGPQGEVTSIVDVWVEDGELYMSSAPESAIDFRMTDGDLEVIFNER